MCRDAKRHQRQASGCIAPTGTEESLAVFFIVHIAEALSLSFSLKAAGELNLANWVTGSSLKPEPEAVKASCPQRQALART